MQFTDRGKIGSSAFAKNIEDQHLNMYVYEYLYKYRYFYKYKLQNLDFV